MATANPRKHFGARIRNQAWDTIGILRKRLDTKGYKSSDGQALEYALAYVQLAESRGIDTIAQVVAHDRRIT